MTEAIDSIHLNFEDKDKKRQGVTIKGVSTRMAELEERSNNLNETGKIPTYLAEADFTKLLAEQLSQAVNLVKEAANADNALAGNIGSVDKFFGSLEVGVGMEMSGRIEKMTGQEFIKELSEPCSSAENFPSFDQKDLSKLGLSELIVFKRILFSAREYGKSNIEKPNYTAQEYNNGFRMVADIASRASVSISEKLPPTVKV